MRVMVQLLAPGVEHGEAAELGPEMFGVLSNVLECLGDGAKEQAIEWARVLEHQRPQIVWQGKDDMGVGRLEHLAFPGRVPRRSRRAMTFGAATVAAGVVGLDLVATLVTLRRVPPKGCSPADRESPEGAVLLWR